MTIAIDIGTFIEQAPNIRGGKPCLSGTGMTVHRIVRWYKLGLLPEEILDRIGHPTLTLAHIYAALTYYQANQAAIETEIAFEDAEAERLMHQHLQSDPS
ncbi:MAG: DUF433 domain-containing protein [Leptolyngbyaceae cyanobacterium bins.349]|nr:DUF433 domain-containing protein [Leptolyngbyaceae cyanobacterium bins.349]